MANNEPNPQDIPPVPETIQNNESPRVPENTQNNESTACILTDKVENRTNFCAFCKVHGGVRARGSGSNPTLVTSCEVRLHDTENDLWLVSRGIVYDVSLYINEHPGGRRSLLRRGGGVQDCCQDYDFHSRRGRSVWEKLRVAKVVACESLPYTLPPIEAGETCMIL